MKVRKKKRLSAQGENKDLYQRAVFEMRTDDPCEMIVAGETTDKKKEENKYQDAIILLWES